jgi:phosphatidylglycerophosphate synthase
MKTLSREYISSLKRPDVEEWADLFLFRPLAFLLVKAIFRTSLTPNQLSVFSVMLGVAAGILFGTGGPVTAGLGAALFFLSIVVDCADGQLARLKKNGTPLGRLVDGAIDYVVGVAVYLGLGFGFTAVSSRPLHWWILILAAAASNILHSVVFDYYRNRYLAYVHGVSSALTDTIREFRSEYKRLARQPGQGLRRRFIRLYLGYTAFQLKLSRDPMTMGPVEPEVFRRENRLAMRLWTFLGSSTQGILLIAAILLARLDLYLWMMIVVLNIGMVALFLGQAGVDRRLKKIVSVGGFSE